MKKIFRQKVFILSAKRTAFGSFLGSLQKLSATELGALVAKEALVAAKLSPQLIDHVIFGNVLQTSKDAIYLARHIGLRAEIPEEIAALVVNRLCGSGFEAMVQASRMLESDEAHTVLVGGSENMSQAPFVVRGARSGLALGSSAFEDSLWECLNDSFVNMPMAITAENLAERYQIGQEEVDAYSLQSQQRYQEAKKNKAFVDEIAAISLQNKTGVNIFEHDEHPRADSSLEKFKKLPKVFKKDGVIHAGAASGISDGAGALVMCNESFLATQPSLKPLAELVSFGISGCDPKIMGLGPVPAIKSALKKIDLSLDDMDMIEINEAFAPQVLAVKKELKINDAKLNLHGGAIAIGHPLAATGARIGAHMVHSLRRLEKTMAIGAACIGGGQGIAVVVKRV